MNSTSTKDFYQYQALLFTFFFLFYSSVLISAQQNEPPQLYNYRLCVPSHLETLCHQMVNDLSQDKGKLTCVSANGKIGCIDKVVKDEADFLPLEPEEIFVAHKFKENAFAVIGEIRSLEFKERNYRYEPVSVVRNSAAIKKISDLRGKKSCHTGYGRNAGWKIPFSHLMDKGELPNLCNDINAATPERDLFAISKYFGKVCAPGPWVPEKDFDATLRTKYSNLCQLCEDPRTCNGKDKYAGYEGALKCLTENNGDIAWTKMDAVEKFFKLKAPLPSPIVQDYSFLCWDGSSQPLISKNPCSWAKRPWRAFLASHRLSVEAINDLQKQINLYITQAQRMRESGSIVNWDVKVLELNSTNEVDYRYPPHMAKSISPLSYLISEKNYSVTIEKPSCSTARVVRICVKNLVEKYKCMDLQLASIGKRIVPGFDCILSDSTEKCFKKISNGEADIMVVGPKVAAEGKKNYGLVPILNALEVIDVNSTEKAPYKFALAVIRSDSKIQNVTDLKGKKSCHGSIQSLAGWNIPLNTLRSLNVIAGPDCGLSIELSKFFNASCIPGVLKAREKMSWIPESLCDLCQGDGTPTDAGIPPTSGSFCQDGSAERYFGSSGALQCLVDQVADVAFVDHVSLLHQKTADPATLSLLCSKGQIMDVSEYRHCNWGRIPSSIVLARGGDENKIEREDARLSFLKASEAFSPSGSYAVMPLFGPYYSNNNVLVQDSSVGFANAAKDPATDELIDQFDFCVTSSARIIFSNNGIVHILTFVTILRTLNK